MKDIQVSINAESKKIPENLNIPQLLNFLELKDDLLVVELNEEVVMRAELGDYNSWRRRQTRNSQSHWRRVMSDSFRIGVREFQSRLMIGTGKYANDQLAIDAIRESGADIVTMAIRRVNLGQNKDESNILELISPDEFTILPNTAGCFTAEESVRTCKLARELLGGHSLVKLEVIGDKNTLLPDMPETLKSSKGPC